MGFYGKETYERKRKWAEQKNSDQAEIGTENGMTEEQAEAMKRLCRDRHYLHTHAGDLFEPESADHDTIVRMLDEEYDSENRIGFYLQQAGFENTLSFDTINLDDDFTYSIDREFKDDDEREKARIEALEKSREFMEEVNTRIERFMTEIDERYGTHFCPTGFARMQ